MNPWRWVDPRVGTVRVADLRAYLLDHGWQLRASPNDRTLLFDKALIEGEAPVSQTIPSSEDFSDYCRVMAESLTILSEIENRHPVELLDDILHAHAGNSSSRKDAAPKASRPSKAVSRRGRGSRTA